MGRLAMNGDERREAAIAACRRAITRWIASEGAEGGRQLRAALHALSAAGSKPTESLRPGVMRRRKAKRRKAT